MTYCCSDDEVAWIQDRITKTRLLIEAYEDAILQLSTGAVQSYSLDTGQTRQTVTKASLGQLGTTLKGLEARLQHYQAKLCGGASVVVRPGF